MQQLRYLVTPSWYATPYLKVCVKHCSDDLVVELRVVQLCSSASRLSRIATRHERMSGLRTCGAGDVDAVKMVGHTQDTQTVRAGSCRVRVCIVVRRARKKAARPHQCEEPRWGESSESRRRCSLLVPVMLLTNSGRPQATPMNSIDVSRREEVLDNPHGGIAAKPVCEQLRLLWWYSEGRRDSEMWRRRTAATIARTDRPTFRPRHCYRASRS